MILFQVTFQRLSGRLADASENTSDVDITSRQFLSDSGTASYYVGGNNKRSFVRYKDLAAEQSAVNHETCLPVVHFVLPA